MKKSHKQTSEDLHHIRAMMERSSRFISLNGIAGVMAGIVALIAGFIAKHWLESCSAINGQSFESCENIAFKFFILAFATMLLSVGGAVYFTVGKSKKKNLPIWTRSTKNMLLNFSIPLWVGFLVCLSFYFHQSYVYIIPSTLVFYGLGLISAGNFTFGDIRYLGISEVMLGVIGFFYFDHAIELWMLGFGVLHIIYGLVMYRKYQ